MVYEHKTYNVKNDNFKIDNHFQPIKRLGKGAYGLVVSAKDRRTQEKVAIKKIRGCFENLNDAKRILREVKLLQHLDHPNIITMVDMINPETERDFNDVYLVLEYMQSDLHKIIYSENRLTSTHIAFIIFQILCGLKYMHSARIIHRDLKPGNILINSDCQVKICDLGLARGVSENDALLTEYVVTRWYRAPEVVINACQYDEAVDMWAVGCILAEMYLREPVFQGEDYIDQLHRIFCLIGTPSPEDVVEIFSEEAVEFMRKQKPKARKDFSIYFPTASEQGLDLLQQMLVFDPAKRITVDEALQHPFFEKFQDSAVVDVSEFEGIPLDMSFEDVNYTKNQLQDAMFDEIRHFRPDAPEITRKNQRRSRFSFL